MYSTVQLKDPDTTVNIIDPYNQSIIDNVYKPYMKKMTLYQFACFQKSNPRALFLVPKEDRSEELGFKKSLDCDIELNKSFDDIFKCPIINVHIECESLIIFFQRLSARLQHFLIVKTLYKFMKPKIDTYLYLDLKLVTLMSTLCDDKVIEAYKSINNEYYNVENLDYYSLSNEMVMHILNIQFNLNDNINKFSTKLMKLIRLVFKANESTERKIVYDLLFLSEVFELGEYEKRDLLKKYSSDIVEAIDEYKKSLEPRTPIDEYTDSPLGNLFKFDFENLTPTQLDFVNSSIDQFDFINFSRDQLFDSVTVLPREYLGDPTYCISEETIKERQKQKEEEKKKSSLSKMLPSTDSGSIASRRHPREAKKKSKIYIECIFL